MENTILGNTAGAMIIIWALEKYLNMLSKNMEKKILLKKF